VGRITNTNKPLEGGKKMRKKTIAVLAALVVGLMLLSLLPMNTSSTEETTSRVGGDIDVLVYYCDYDNRNVHGILNADSRFGTVVLYNGYYSGVPSLAYFQQYDVVVTWTNYPYRNAVQAGNTLKDYVDGGGGVLLLAFSSIGLSWNGYQLQGSFYSMGYNPIGYSNSYGLNYAIRMGTILQPSHPILDGVSDVGPGFHIYTSVFSSGATRIFYWNNGYAGCGVKEIGGGRTCGLNQMPGYDRGAHCDLIIANAAAWCAGVAAIPADVRVEPQSLNLESNGNWVQFKIYGFPDNPEYTHMDVDPTTVKVEGVDADLKFGTWNDNKFIGKADRMMVQDAIGGPGDEVEVRITGKLNDDTAFAGAATIKAIQNQ
jgi:hypothetical protein